MGEITTKQGHVISLLEEKGFHHLAGDARHAWWEDRDFRPNSFAVFGLDRYIIWLIAEANGEVRERG